MEIRSDIDVNDYIQEIIREVDKGTLFRALGCYYYLQQIFDDWYSESEKDDLKEYIIDLNEQDNE